MMDKFNVDEFERDYAYSESSEQVLGKPHILFIKDDETWEIRKKSEDLGEADVWHEGTKSFYRARLLKKLTSDDTANPTDALPPDEGLNPKGPRWL